MNPSVATHQVARSPALFALFSLAMGLFVLLSTASLEIRDGHQAMPPIFVVILLVILLAGVALGIFAVAWNKGPRRRGVLIAGVFGICMNAFLLLPISGLASANHGPPSNYSSIIGSK